MATNWIEVMPALPCTVDSVPLAERLEMEDGSVVLDRRGIYSDGHVLVDDTGGPAVSKVGPLSPSMRDVSGDEWIVDLEHPQGFGYALQSLLLSVRDEDVARAKWPSAWNAAWMLSNDFAVLRGETTPAIRLALALALAEVS